MRRSTSQDAAFKYALRQMIASAIQLLAITEATDLPEPGMIVVHRRTTIPERIESILLRKGPMGMRQIFNELAHDGHRPVTKGTTSGTLDTMKKRGQVAYDGEKWHLTAGR